MSTGRRALVPSDDRRLDRARYYFNNFYRFGLGFFFSAFCLRFFSPPPYDRVPSCSAFVACVRAPVDLLLYSHIFSLYRIINNIITPTSCIGRRHRCYRSVFFFSLRVRRACVSMRFFTSGTLPLCLSESER